jgi:hypothetical protein
VILRSMPASWDEYTVWAGHQHDQRDLFTARWRAIDTEVPGLPLPVLVALWRMALMQGPFTRADLAATPDRVLLGVHGIGPRRLADLRAAVPYCQPEVPPGRVDEGTVA